MKNLYQEYELEAYLGESIDDFDIEAIVDEATEIDYSDGNRYWKEGIDLAEICAKHDRAIANMTIKDHISGRNVEVEVVSSEQISDGTLHVVRYTAKTSAEVDCEFSIIEYPDNIVCQSDWQCRPATADEIEDTNWSDCTPSESGDVVSATEAAEMLGVSRMRVNQLLNESKLDGRKVGNAWQVYRYSVEERMR